MQNTGTVPASHTGHWILRAMDSPHGPAQTLGNGFLRGHATACGPAEVRAMQVGRSGLCVTVRMKGCSHAGLRSMA